MAAAAMAATDPPPPRAAPGKRTASEAGDADAPSAKRDCTTSAVNDQQQTCLAALLPGAPPADLGYVLIALDCV